MRSLSCPAHFSTTPLCQLLLYVTQLANDLAHEHTPDILRIYSSADVQGAPDILDDLGMFLECEVQPVSKLAFNLRAHRNRDVFRYASHSRDHSTAGPAFKCLLRAL
jgi:hypothetical protein